MQSLKKYHPEIISFLNTYLAQKGVDYAQYPYGKDIQDKLIPYVTHGKLVRGSLFLATKEILCEEPISQSDYEIAGAIELLHSAFLIQDDIMDKDELRRGKPSMHTQYKSESLAMCLSDICFFCAFELFKLPYPALIDVMIRTGLGQMSDVAPVSLSTEGIKQTYEAKTAYYTFYLPMQLAYATSNKQEFPQLLNLAKELGLLFQLTDDILGYNGDTNKTGKKTGSDIAQRRHTMYIADLLTLCTETEKHMIQMLYKKAELSGDEVTIIYELCEKYGVIEHLQQKISQIHDRITQECPDCKPHQKAFITEIASYLVSRCS